MLSSLVIKNFRALEDFSIPKLGRVNLIVGKNNSGKSSLLEALHIYAGNAKRVLLEQISASHEEKYRLKDGERIEQDIRLPFEDYFTGRLFPATDDKPILIGESADGTGTLRIQRVFLSEKKETVKDATGETSTHRRSILLKASLPGSTNDESITQVLFVSKEDRSGFFTLDTLIQTYNTSWDLGDELPCSFISTRFVSSNELADEWDKIALTEYAEVVKEALRIIAPEFENLAFVRHEDAYPPARREFYRSAMVKISSSPRPVPLKSLGDGMLRVLQLVLKVFPAKGGFLLIDEFENGLHYSVQEKVLALLFELAQKHDIQIFATTHSWDCIESFAKVAVARSDVEGVLIRVGRSVRASDHGRVIATVFDEEQLVNITQADVEVR